MELKIEDKIDVTGRGTVLLVDLEKNGFTEPKKALEFLKKGIEIKTNEGNYLILGVETQGYGEGNISKNIGLNVRPINMTYDEKVEKYSNRNTRDAFKDKTPFDELPIKFGHGSSTHHPEAPRTGMTTCDIKLWMKFLHNWFHPYGGFSQDQVEQMIEICRSDQQIDCLMALLSAK